MKVKKRKKTNLVGIHTKFMFENYLWIIAMTPFDIYQIKYVYDRFSFRWRNLGNFSLNHKHAQTTTQIKRTGRS